MTTMSSSFKCKLKKLKNGFVGKEVCWPFKTERIHMSSAWKDKGFNSRRYKFQLVPIFYADLDHSLQEQKKCFNSNV